MRILACAVISLDTLNLMHLLYFERWYTVVLLIGAVSAANIPEKCTKEFVDPGLSTHFNKTTAHSIHSMIQGLRLFNPHATAKNQIHTVNHNLHGHGHS
ncbi:unnamed protein product [Didymodactylos carnosus]|uniref:Uncharacterized protein n=1 Tax=Didymodactylos carnosus TaxID=1234261 RepID=A0A813WIS8_9BILA|nr:unnamed protein product [Didymodactylos carnosus]CAF0855994.1 unnamed protein product [Didymodactylos carnosus]CAF3531729.1 unnamed protein product [Didymodactylos carnosus]CAF3643760.1 unnamed protein product [Didymodactylos carnosus]